MNVQRLKGEMIAQLGTQKAFARAMHWQENKVTRMLQGRYLANVDEAFEIACVLQLSLRSYRDIFLLQRSPNGEKRNVDLMWMKESH